MMHCQKETTEKIIDNRRDIKMKTIDKNIINQLTKEQLFDNI